MSIISTDDVLHISRLANLSLEKQEIEKLKKQLSEIIDYFDELRKIPTDNVLPTAQTTGLESVFREDRIESTRILSSGDATSGTDKIHNNMFIVPQVIDKTK